jgi:EmrB/QacA subfamily drug resistance transporter
VKVHGQARWLALMILCLGDLMIVLDSTIVNVALPSIRDDLGFSQTSLAWVVNAYLLTFGGFLLLGGRLGDLFGRRRLFLAGTVLFTAASLACGLSTTQHLLIAARAVQGVGGAVVSAVALSLIMVLFTEAGERARAMGIFGFVLSGGGTLGVLLGGILTDVLDWHWIFLVNLPIGVLVTVLSLTLLPVDVIEGERPKLDVSGAVAITGSLMLAVYAIVNGNDAGWTSVQTLGLLGLAVVLLAAFLVVESRAAAPLVPLSLFRLRNLSTANAIAILMAGALFAGFFLTSLYLQQILGYSPLQVGLAFVPSSILWGGISLLLSDRAVMRFGFRLPVIGGFALFGVGVLWLAFAPVDGTYAVHVLPGMLLQGFGAGIAFNPLLLSAMSDVRPEESGLASGVVNTSFTMGGALGLAILAALASSRTDTLAADGASHLEALNGGYHAAFVAGAIFAAIGVTLGWLRLQNRPREAAGEVAPAVAG